MAINWLATGNYLTIHYGSSKPCSLEKGTEKYDKIISLLVSNAPEQTIIDALDISQAIQTYSNDTFKVDPSSGSVLIDDQEIHGSIADKITAFYRSNLPYLPLINFWRNIQSNPSEESKAHLFAFLNANNMSITHDGCFIAYKKVTRDKEGNLVDCHSKTFCNNIGSVVTMDRNKVNPNRNETCSTGLHVGAYDYVKNFDGSDLLECKINPKDVVAVPDDYNNQKMRVCRYEVVSLNKGEEITKPLIDKKELEIKTNDSIKTESSKKLEQIKLLPVDSTIKFDGLTAKHVAEAVLSLTGIDILIGLKDLKNKQAIIKRAQVALKTHGFFI